MGVSPESELEEVGDAKGEGEAPVASRGDGYVDAGGSCPTDDPSPSPRSDATSAEEVAARSIWSRCVFSEIPTHRRCYTAPNGLSSTSLLYPLVPTSSPIQITLCFVFRIVRDL